MQNTVATETNLAGKSIMYHNNNIGNNIGGIIGNNIGNNYYCDSQAFDLWFV